MKQIIYATLLLVLLCSCRKDEEKVTTTEIEAKPILASPTYKIPEELRYQLERIEIDTNTKITRHEIKIPIQNP